MRRFRSHGAARARAGVALLAACCGLVAVACGSNRPEIPPELLLLPEAGAGSYPPPPYGGQVGDFVQDFGFTGWRDPATVGADPAAFEAIRVSDYHDPYAVNDVALLLLNTAALWCQACKIEHEELPPLYDRLAPRGFRMISALFQDNFEQPATATHLQIWAEDFASNYPLVLDPDYQMGAFGPGDKAPINVLVDPRDQRVLRVFSSGESLDVVSAAVEAELTARGR